MGREVNGLAGDGDGGDVEWVGVVVRQEDHEALGIRTKIAARLAVRVGAHDPVDVGLAVTVRPPVHLIALVVRRPPGRTNDLPGSILIHRTLPAPVDPEPILGVKNRRDLDVSGTGRRPGRSPWPPRSRHCPIKTSPSGW